MKMKDARGRTFTFLVTEKWDDNDLKDFGFLQTHELRKFK